MKNIALIITCFIGLSFSPPRTKTYSSFSKALKSKNEVLSIRCLNFNEREIEVFRKNIDKFKNLKELVVLGDYKEFKTEFPEEIFELAQLETLQVDAFKPESFERLHNLSKLKSVGFTRASLNEIPVEFLSLPNLEYLGLDINNINSIPKEISRLNNLEYLSFRNNAFQEIPITIVHLEKLKTIDFGNQEGGGNPKPIWGKPMRYNDIQEFPTFLGSCKQLEHVILAFSCSSEMKSKLESSFPDIKF